LKTLHIIKIKKVTGLVTNGVETASKHVIEGNIEGREEEENLRQLLDDVKGTTGC